MHDLKYFHCFNQFLNLRSKWCRAESIIPCRVAQNSPEEIFTRDYIAGVTLELINLGGYESGKAYTGMIV
jgi:hypothetical protein